MAPTSAASESRRAKQPGVDGPAQLAAALGRELSLSSRSVHADDRINTHPAVAPPLHASTTFRYARDPDELVPWSEVDVSLSRF